MPIEPSNQTVQLSMPLPSGADTRIYIRLTVQARSILLFLTTADCNSANTNAAPLGSFVYALPDVCVGVYRAPENE